MKGLGLGATEVGLIGAPPFPISIDELDTSTLTQALGRPVEGFLSTRIGADRGMLGEIFVLDIDYGARGDGPARVVAKFAALREGSLASARRGGTHERELRCYAELLVDTPVNVPSMHGAWYDPETAHFLLIQDVADADTEVDQIVGIDFDQAQLVLSEAARVHATWWKHDKLRQSTWLPRLDSDQRRTNLTTIAQAGWGSLCELLGDELSEVERSLGTALSARLDVVLQTVAALPSTLIHSDLRADNLLFSPDGGSVSLIDWQGAGIGPPGFDLAYFMSQCLTVETRRAHEDELLDYYRGELAAAGVELTSDDVRAGYGESMIYGLTIACALPLISDPGEPRVRALAASMARRSIEALRDHNQLWER